MRFSSKSGWLRLVAGPVFLGATLFFTPGCSSSSNPPAADTAPVISQQPADKSVTDGQSAVFSVTASGSGTLAYQWTRAGVAIPGATDATYTLPAAAYASDNGAKFAVKVVNAAGTATSNTATLTVNAIAPVVTAQPASRSVAEGQTATFSVTATGTGPLTYQWKRGAAIIANATAATYTTSATSYAADNGASFTVTVTNAAGVSVTSSAALLTVTVAAPVITTQPASKTVVDGASASFTVGAQGTGLTYQWKRNGTSIAGATAAAYTIPSTVYATDNGAAFTVTVTGGNGLSVSSDNAHLTVTDILPTAATPANQTAAEGQTATFTVTASGTGPLSYAWKRGGVVIPGATSASYTTPAVTYAGDNGATFSVTVTNGAAHAMTTGAATLTVTSPAPTITTPAPQTVADGQTATFSATATGGVAPLSYQWKRGGTAVGTNAASYTTPATVYGSDNGATFTVTVTDSLGHSATSGSAALTVTPVAPVLTGPANQTVTVGQPATFSVAATGTAPFSYVWKRDGVVIAGATSASCTTAATTSADNGAIFTVTVSNPANQPVTSAGATLTVSPSGAPTVTDPASMTVAEGQTASFSVTATGTAPLSYVWKRNGVAIPGATAASYTTPATTWAADNNAKFTVTVTNGASQSITSGAATLTVTDIAPVIVLPAPAALSDGGAFSLTATPTGSAPFTYQWVKNGANVATTATYSISNVNYATDNGAVIHVIVTNAAGHSTPSNDVTLVVNPVAPSIVTQPASQTVVVGQAATFTVVASGSALKYQWQRDGAALSGATASSYTTAATTSADSGATFNVVVSTSASAQTVTSATATLTVQAGGTNPIITVQPKNSHTYIPDAGVFKVTAIPATPGHTLTYQWYKGSSAISGATTDTYTTAITGMANTASSTYYVVIKDGTYSTTSATVTQTITAPDPVYTGAGDPILVQPTTRQLTILPSAVVDDRFPNGCYRFGYEEAYKTPLWTAYCQFKRPSNYPAGSRNFSADSRLLSPQVDDSDYGNHGGAGFFLSGGNGFDRGHMVPIADLSYAYGSTAGTSTCKMSNISAQVSYYNQRLWLDFENAVGALTDAGGAFNRTWIYSGNIYADIEKPTNLVNYWQPVSETYTTTRPTGSTLGIGIPVACYKVIVVDPLPGETLPRVMSWVSGNRVYQTAERADMWKYCTSVARIEQLTGLDFFPNLPHDASLAAFKNTVDVRGWGSSFEKSSGPNVHIVSPSWDIKAPGTGSGSEYVIQPYPKANEVITFEGAASTTASGSFTAASWNFGDGSGVVPVTLTAVKGMAGDKRTHAFTSTGTFTVTFSATDGSGSTNTITRIVNVK